jgi:adenylate kinase family enzyme
VDRVVVVGGPGSGKSSVATHLAAVLGIEHVELDGLWWGRGWVHVDPGTFMERVRDRLRVRSRWVVDGNYLEEGGRLVWRAADTLVWLDLPRRIAVRGAVVRTTRRVLVRQALWHGNRESLRILGPRSLSALWRRWPSYGGRISSMLAEPEAGHLDVVRLRSPSDVRR